MSTPGKVLLVLVIMAEIGFIFLTAKMANLVTNWSREVANLKTQVGQLETDVIATRTVVRETLDQVLLQQEKQNRQLAVLRSHLSDLRADEGHILESLTRVELALGVVKQAGIDANELIAQRDQEHAETQQALDEARKEVGDLQEVVDNQLDRLQKLREDFATTMEENRSLLDQLRVRTGSTGRIRAASLTR